ncbi:hypothetical protein KY363_00805 [Candidatus Woesearchaeota archaeon]|nr:hypothetical protein [Candidatus Woesearchaeota archaeon]
MSIELRLAGRVNDDDVGLLADILNKSWNTGITEEMMRMRLDSGSLFIIGYDRMTDHDRIILRSDYRIDCQDRMYPIGILQTVDINTGGDLDKVPKTYDELTCGGLWKPYTFGDTMILADITMIFSRRGNKHREARTMVTFAKNIAAALHKHVYTYTPDIEAVKDWHISNGARDTGYKIKCARPDYSQPDVNLMEYSF